MLSHRISSRRQQNVLVLITTLTCVASVAPNAGAAPYIWQNSLGGTWTTSGNWNLAGEPDDATDTASIGNISGAYTVTLNGTRTIGGLTLSGTDPTLTLSNPLTISGGTSTISGGTLNGTSIMRWTNGAVVNWSAPTAPGGSVIFEVPDNQTITVNNTGAFALSSGQTLRLLSTATGGTLATTTFSNGFTNGGTIQLGTIPPGDNYGVNRLIVTTGAITNSIGGQINFYPRSATDGGAPWNTREIRAGIANAGTITSYSTDGIIGAAGQAVTNTGTLSTNHSIYTTASIVPKLTIVGSTFTNTGALTIGAGGGSGHIAIRNTTTNFNSGSTITGPGTLEVTGTTVSFNAGTTITGLTTLAMGQTRIAPSYLANPTTVNWNIADLTGPMTFRVNPNAEVTLNRSSAWTLPANQVLEFFAPDPIGIGHPTSLTIAQDFNNNGTVRMGVAAPGDNYVNAQLILTGTSTFTNNASGVVNMHPRSATNDTAPWFNRWISANVVNNGTINSYAGGGRLGDTGKTVTNAGTINVDSSSLTSPREAQIQFAGTTATNTGTINLIGGQLWVNSSTFNYNGGAINATTGSDIILGSSGMNTNFNYNGGAEITGPVSWFVKDGQAATITRTSTWNILAGQSLSYEVQTGLSQARLTVNQNMTNSGSIILGKNAPGDNYVQQWLSFSGAGTQLTNNAAGTIFMYPRSATSLDDTTWSQRRIEGSLINDGQLTVYTRFGNIGKAGSGHINNGVITFDKSIYAMGVTGFTPTLYVTGSTMLNDVNGVIRGNGILNTTGLTAVAGTWNNAGTISPGMSAGTLQVIGNTNFLSGSELVIEVTGAGAVGGVDYDVLTLTGTVSGLNNLDVVVDVNALLSKANLAGDVLTILTVSGTNITSGMFNSITFTNDWRADVTFLSNSVLLSNFQSTVPEPSTFALLGLGAIGMAVKARRRRQAAA